MNGYMAAEAAATVVVAPRSGTVAAVVVTFNRKQLLAECLDALLNQTQPLDRIIIVDNASSDGTLGFLAKRGYLGSPLIDYVRLPENIGGAGGFHFGTKRGYEAGYGWLWVMDDDAEPRPDALSILAEEFTNQETGAVACLKTSPDGTPQYQHRGWIKQGKASIPVIKAISQTDIDCDVDIEHASFVGLCISREVFQLVGFPKKEFFIHYDDLEFCMRMLSVKKIKLKVKSIILHKDYRKSQEQQKFFWGRTSIRLPYEQLWLRYYGLRNVIWISRNRCGVLILMAFSIKYLLKKYVGILIYDDHKVQRMKFWTSAIMDGWNGVFDNAKPKLILYHRVP